MKVCCVLSLESPHWGEKYIHSNLSLICSYGIFSKGLKNEFETAVVNKPSEFEPLKFYYITQMKGGAHPSPIAPCRALVAQWVKCWSTDLAVPSSIPARGRIFSTVFGVPLYIAFHYQPLIILIWLKYCWKRRKIASHSSILMPLAEKGDKSCFPWIHIHWP